MNVQDFIHHSFFDDYEYWSVRDASNRLHRGVCVMRYYKVVQMGIDREGLVVKTNEDGSLGSEMK